MKLTHNQKGIKMKKILLPALITIFLLSSTACFAGNYVINIKIGESNLQRIINAILYFKPIPQIPDPTWSNPGDGSEAPLVGIHTEKEWIKVQLIKYLSNMTLEYERKMASKAAKESIAEEDIAE